jgi:hypothetical protein
MFDQKAYNKAYRQKNREKINSLQRERREKDPEKYRAKANTYNANNKDKVLKNWLKTTYGMSLEEYDALFKEQDGKCAICGEHQGSLSKRLGVDHCHETGKVRGLLCDKCNVSLGNFQDDVNLLGKAIEYLNFHGKS